MNESIWKYVEPDFKVYTESKELYKILISKKFNLSTAATYLLKGKEVGWDFVVSENKISEVKKLIKEINDIEKRNQKAKDKLTKQAKKHK